MEAWKADLHMPLGIDVFWQEHGRGDAAPSVELLERWNIMYVSLVISLQQVTATINTRDYGG